ncbi:ABC transporter [Roseovarius sp. HI0049]|nr:ABC transporter [Roseovarius sp. HI0049]
MSGLLALLDDVAALAKVAAASVDDVAGQAAKAGAKAAGAVIDDAAVTPKYLTGFAPARELPIVWRIARGSLINKLVFLLPAGLALSAFAPWLIPPLLMLGGAYLCFEGAEKVAHALGFAHEHGGPDGSHKITDPAHLEEAKIKGAIKTDFILSAEIMTIALAAIPPSNIWMEGATLAVVAVGITAAVYGAVALIVKADDVGLYLAENGMLGLTRALGRWIVRAMPRFMWLLTVVGTAAMLWVGGSIIIHGLDTMGWPVIYDGIHHFAEDIGHEAGRAEGAVTWGIVAALDGVFGLALGLVLVPVGTRLIAPVWQRVAKLNPFV